MDHWIQFWPRTAAVNGEVVNALYIAELAICGLILMTVVGLMFSFCVRYRAGSTASRANLTEKTWHWEIGWTTATLVLLLIGFVWGAAVYIWLYKSPLGDLEVYVVGKQWMWKMEHPGGQREIDALHVPVDKTVRLLLASCRTSSTASSFRRSVSSTTPCPASTRRCGSRPPSPAHI